MRLSERAIELPRLVILSAVLACVIGTLAAMTLPKERTPRIRLPVILVAVPNPGSDPTTNEREIIRRIEDEAGLLSGLKSEGAIHSQAVHGAALMQFMFDDGVSPTEAKRDVESLVNRVKGQFPRPAQQDPGPLVKDIAFEDWPIIQVFIAGGADGQQRRRIAERLKVVIEKADGVAGVDIFGGLEREVQIEVDPHRMVLYGFNYDQVAEAVRRANSVSPSGAIESAGGADSRLRTADTLPDLDAVRRVPLGVRQGKALVLQDVAEVSMGHKPVKSLARYGSEDAAVLLVRARTDIDVLGAAEHIQRLVDKFIADGQGEDTHIGTVRSQAREIHYMLNQLGSSALYGMILVIILLWIFMGWRNAAMISIAVPFSIMTTAGFIWLAKKSFWPDLAINNMTLFGMILVVGMVVDGCIIVGENIYRHRELGRPPVDAAKRGIVEVGASVLAAYLTTFAAFAPMFLIRGIMGDFMQLLPVVVIFALCAAMLVDHFLLPVLSVYLMKPRRAAAASLCPRLPGPGRGKEADHDLTQEQIEIRDAQAIVAASGIKQTYGRMLGYALHHRLLVLTLAVVTALSPVALYFAGAIPIEFFPETDVPIIEVYFELPLGSSMEKRTAHVADKIEQAVVRAVRAEEWYRPGPGSPRAKPVTTIGEPGALNIRLDTETGAGPEFGLVYVELELAENRQRTAAQIRNAIARELPPLPGVIVRIKSPREGPPAGAPVLVRVLAQKQATLDTLAQRASRVEELLRSVPGVYDVTSDFRLRPQLEARPDLVVARLFDVDAAQITTSVNYALEGVDIGDVDFGGDESMDLRLRNLPQYRDELRDLLDLPLASPTGRVVELGQVAQVQRIRAANVIRHYDSKRVVNVRAELRDSVTADQVKARLVAALRPELPASQQRAVVRGQDILASDADVVIEFGGENELRDDAIADLQVAMVLALALMIVVLVVKFNSFIQTAIVLFSVPLSLVGVALGLMVCGLSFSVASMIGVVALSGIVVNDAIVLVDFINIMRRAGVRLEQAVVFAGQLRLRPIFLTTVTTIGGLLPLALNLSGGGEFWQPLTVSIICGLAFATLLQLFIIPLACYTFDRSKHASVLDPMSRAEFSGTPAALPTN